MISVLVLSKAVARVSPGVPLVSESKFDSRPGTRSNETVFLGKSPVKTCIQLVLLALAASAVAAAFAASEEFRNFLRVDKEAGGWALAFSGGAATVLFVCAFWMWTSRLRWVAVSLDGIRWYRGTRARRRRWDEYVGVQRGSIEITVWGEDLKSGRYADIKFRKGRPLRISTHTVYGYEDLIAEIQTTSAEAIQLICPIGGSHNGADQEMVAYGPLRFLPNGLEWGGARYRWNDIEAYEVAVGYLRIQPAKGPEFLRRLSELGDWTPAVARLDVAIGSKRAIKGKPIPTAASLRSPMHEAAPSPY
jgi:hypothetical protein